MRAILVVAAALLMAQAPMPPVVGPPPAMLSMPTPPMPQAAVPGHMPTGNAVLDQAIALCDGHQGFPVLIRGSRGATTPTWQPGYEVCAQIVPMWALNVTLTATQQATVTAFLAAH